MLAKGFISKGKKSSQSGTGRSNHRTIEVSSATAVLRNNLPLPKIHSGNHRLSQHSTLGSDTIPSSGDSSPKNTRTGPDNEPPSQHPGARSGNDTASQYTGL